MAFVGVSVFAVTIPTDFTYQRTISQYYPPTDPSPLERDHSKGITRDLDDPRLQANVDALQRNYAVQQEQLDQLQSHQNPPYTALLGRALRPFGMLIFVEGIAWFLLRQYRLGLCTRPA
jgi:hypothetical protein